MLQILIVDDEYIERQGIKRLIHKYNLELSVTEAENGDEALEVLGSRSIDILFTDIKMPFMDGLELCKRAREQYPELKIIIFSAFGEFEYAQRAIHYHINAYLLKPIDVNDFIREFTNVIELCNKEREQREAERILLEGYHKGMEYERENLLLDLVSGSSRIAPEQFAQAGIDLSGKCIRMILVDFADPVFDASDDGLPAIVKPLIPAPFEYVNLNENQSLLLVLYDQDRGLAEQPNDLGNRLKDELTVLYKMNVTLVMGRPVLDVSELVGELRSMESTNEEKFFYQESTVLYTDESQANRDLSDAIPKLADTINWHLEAKDYFGLRRGVELFFKTIEGSGQHSAIYIKYVCIELAKKVLEAAGKNDKQEFKGYVEDIFGSKTVTELRGHLYGAIDQLNTADVQNPEFTKKVIKDIVKLIDDNYMTDISLGWIADKVYLTQTYLSYLFSKEMGQTLVKYMTQVRMQKAAELLRSTNITISDISVKVGFMNDSYFCKIFKNHHGISPAKYREVGS